MGYLGRLLWTLQKAALPLIGSVLKPLAKSALTPLGLTAAPSATNAATHKKMFGTGIHLSDLTKQTTFIISNEETTSWKLINILMNLLYK